MSDATLPASGRDPGARWPKEALPAVAAGFLWLSFAYAAGWLGFLLAALPGALLLGTGVSSYLAPGERRVNHYMAIGGVIGALFGVGAFFGIGPFQGLLLIALSAASFVMAGRLAIHEVRGVEGAPHTDGSLRQAAEVAIDEALLATMSARMVLPSLDEHPRIVAEVRQALEQFEARGVLEKPASYHQTPPPLVEPRIDDRQMGKLAYRRLRFDSEYEPVADEPGRDRWLSYTPNRTAHAWVLQHDNPARPWLICIHGYQMGSPQIDLRAFEVAQLHHQHGLNVLLPVLPLHGPRAIGRQSGDGFLGGDAMDTIHAVSQATWDIRRCIGWIRAQGGETIGAYGLSLGGYHTAVLAAFEPELACAIAGIPATDVARLVWRHAPEALMRTVEDHGLDQAMMRRVMTVVSPLDLPPVVPKERRTLFGGSLDQLVPADQVRDLWEHWGRPRMEWYPGAHLTFGAHPNVVRVQREALREAGLIA